MKTELDPNDFLRLLVVLGEHAAAYQLDDNDEGAMRESFARFEADRLLLPYGWTIDCFWDQFEAEVHKMFAADYKGPQAGV